MLCRYKDIFGEPRKGVHSIRVADFAAVDVILTIVAAAVIAKALKVNVFATFIVLLIMAIIIHRAFCVQTKLNQMIFNKLNPMQV